MYAGFGMVAVALLLALLSYALAAGALLAGVAVAFLLHKRDVAARTVRLDYAPSGESTSRYEAARAACETLSDAKKVWRVEGDAWDRAAKAAGGEDRVFSGDASTRHPVQVGLLKTPGISANVEIWGMEAGDANLFFLPECVLVYKEDLYRAISYDSLGVIYRPLRAVEDGEFPEDAEIVGETWRFVKADGGPDLRYPNNPKSAVASYGLLSVTGAESREIRILVSNKAVAVRFARAFGSGRDEEHSKEKAGSAREERARHNAEVEAARLGSMLEVLGVAPGASREEINAAYKKQAKMYHPDVVVNLVPEVREIAELRMKEINAAYGELKRRVR